MDALAQLLSSLHEEAAKLFLKRILDGTATPADLSAAVRFLKDNGITSTRVPQSPMQQLADLVPFASPEDADYQ